MLFFIISTKNKTYQVLRHVLHDYIVNDIKSLRASSEAHKLDKELKVRLKMVDSYWFKNLKKF